MSKRQRPLARKRKPRISVLRQTTEIFISLNIKNIPSEGPEHAQLMTTLIQSVPPVVAWRWLARKKTVTFMPLLDLVLYLLGWQIGMLMAALWHRLCADASNLWSGISRWTSPSFSAPTFKGRPLPSFNVFASPSEDPLVVFMIILLKSSLYGIGLTRS